MKLFFDKEGNLMVTCMYSDGEANGKNKLINLNSTYGSQDGLLIATINDLTNVIESPNYISFEKLDFKNEETTKQEKRNDKDVSNLTNITGIELGSKGEILILSEKINVRVVTTTTSSRTGVTSRTRTYYDYGPGLMFNFNADNTFESMLKLDYRKTFAENDPGKGLTYFSGNENTAVVQEEDKFYKVKLDNKFAKFKRSLGMQLGLRAWKNAIRGRYSTFEKDADNVYVFQMKGKKKATIGSFARQ
jgi:hypothetical protein